jgi:hypothetical protein
VKQLFSISRARVALLLAPLCAFLAGGLGPARVGGVVISSGQGNLEPPSDDPGFFNVSDTGNSLVYLGDSWVLTAAHIPVPSAASFAGEQYTTIPNTTITLHNPAGMDLTNTTDLMMFRIGGLPNLPSLEISESTPPISAQVTMIGRGTPRSDTLTQWNVQRQSEDKWTWTETSTGGEFRGYKLVSGVREKRWGTNRVVNEDPIVGESDPGHTAVIEVGSAKREVISVLTIWDQAGGTPHEAQATAGDSGGGVFYKRNGRWELAGIMNATLNFPSQSQGWSLYGQATTFADLSVYRAEILSIMANPNYSIMGDINLDGVVSGDGTGPAESDDLAAFVGGWLTEHPVANIESWKLGDLNQDAVTDLGDFRLLRKAHPDAASLASALGVAATAIPEPASWLLVAFGLPAAGWIARRSLRSRS